ncbi:MAG: hypothetical protein ACFFAU_12470 [Candidatus Hodarchaeota archaeon]
MSSKPLPKRILVTGREVGPIARLLKTVKLGTLKPSIGAVDILGNLDTRIFSDWTFSVEKQSPNKPILRHKRRPLIDLLYELTLILLEEVEFDLLIPLPPFQIKPQYIRQLSKEVPIKTFRCRSLEKIKTSYAFLMNLKSNFPEMFPQPIRFSDLSDSSSISYPFFFVSEHKTDFFLSQEQLLLASNFNEYGFYLPFSNVHCIFFISSSYSINFIGIQSLSSPLNHDFFSSFLEKNAFLPFSFPGNLSLQTIVSFFSEIINVLELFGIISIYFGFVDDKIIPIYCNILPDENIDLWDRKNARSIVQYLLETKSAEISPKLQSNIAFKFPIYSSHSIRVPVIPEIIARQRNLAYVLSDPAYPICTILGKAKAVSALNSLLYQKKTEIKSILGI